MAESSRQNERTVSTYCNQCVAGPDLLKVRIEDGTATEIAPNFDAGRIHPAGGKACVKAYGLVQKLYNPHRILHPMKRSNPRKGRGEDAGFEQISWDEALDLLAQKLNEARARGLLDGSGYPRLAASFGGGGTPTAYMGTLPAFLAAWGPRIPALIVSTGMAEGAGLFLAAIPFFSMSPPLADVAGLTALALAAIRMWNLTYYLHERSEGAPARAIAVLEGINRWFLAIGLGVPAVLIMFAWITPRPTLFGCAGLCIVGAGVALKYLLVARAGYNRGFAIDYTPARGNGVSLRGVKPGWSMRAMP